MVNNTQKRKLSWWWFLAIPCLLLGVLLIQILGPSPPVRLGPTTTRVLEPLRSDGMPNYAVFLTGKASQGITPENNAAVLYWRALWPGELDPKGEGEIVEALQMEWPDAKESLIDVYDPIHLERIRAWIRDHVPDVDPQFLEDEGNLFEIAELGRYQPLNPDEYPFVGTWAEENQQPLDWLVEGARRPRYFSPSPTFTDGSEQTLFYFLIPDIQMLRGGIRALCSRAMWHLSHDRHAECWQDLRACYAISRHSQDGYFMICALVAYATSAMTDNALKSLLQDEEISAELLLEIQQDLEALPEARSMSAFFDEGERCGGLDIVSRMAVGGFSQEEMMDLDMGPLLVASRLRVDWNIVFENTNSWYDRIVEIGKLSHMDREEKLAIFQEDVSRLAVDVNPGRVAQSVLSTRARSEVVADITASLALPSLASALMAEDRFLSKNDLTRIAVALARYRKQNGKYPEKLMELTPDFLDQVPADLYIGEPLHYATRPDGGYLLYSVGPDHIDNGGTGIDGGTVNGEWKDNAPGVDMGACDIVIRLPKPPAKFPGVPLRQEDNVVEDPEDEEELELDAEVP